MIGDNFKIDLNNKKQTIIISNQVQEILKLNKKNVIFLIKKRMIKELVKISHLISSNRKVINSNNQTQAMMAQEFNKTTPNSYQIVHKK